MIWGDLFFWPFALGAGIILFAIKVMALTFVIWMIVDCAQRKFKNEAEKWIWIVLMVFTTLIGAVVYYIAVRAMNPKGVSKK
ncbi:MAG: PLDc N-terminal domain-containing protein [Nanoarchaeota archaeon]